ncbi:MAG: hypothetical protein JO288_21875, partial [Hyphomicrobiales bacterium]|nr:hypothetical protein [Hyphomicrobiales bacterium]
MAVLRFRETAEETEAGKSGLWGAINSGRMSRELIEDHGAPDASLPQLQAPGTIATSDLAMKLAAADAAVSDILELLDKVRESHDELRQSLDDLNRD